MCDIIAVTVRMASLDTEKTIRLNDAILFNENKQGREEHTYGSLFKSNFFHRINK